MKEESLSKELDRKRTEISDYFRSLDLEDKTMVYNKARELFETEELQEAFVKGYNYSSEQPSARVIHTVAMYVFDYVKSKANYINIVKKIYQLYREYLPTLKKDEK